MGFRRRLYKLLPLKGREFLFKRFLMDKDTGYGGVFRTALNGALEEFLSPDEKEDKRLVSKLSDDIISCWIKYKALPYEYFLFNFRNLPARERWEFETDVDRLQTLNRISGSALFLEEINDKYNFYLLAKDFFKREAIKVDKDSSVEDFVAFVQKHPEVFVKPLNSSKGRGARVFTYTDSDSAAGFFFPLLDDGAEWMVEEKIRQSAEMAQWNASSVNTIRIPTFLRDGEFTVIWTRMRTGKKGAIVDNAGQGGIVVNVDPSSGVVTTDGIDEAYHHFEAHPDTHIPFKGWQVPRWEELLSTVERLHRSVFSRHIYIAWDFALTDDGWVVIEGNWGQLLGQQTASQKGVRREFHRLMGDDL